MALLRDRATAERTHAERPGTGEVIERTGPTPGTVRALFTLVAVGGAGLLVWIAQTFDWRGSTGEFWVAMGLLAAAGLALGLSQLFGGWTKWGWPTLSPGMFLFAFLPTLVAGGWILLAKQPQAGVEEGRFDRWSGDIGIGGLVNDLATFLPVIPLVIGLVFAFTFDTTGPRTRRLVRDPEVRDEEVHDYRRETATSRDASGDEDVTTRDEETDTVAASSRDERAESRDAERRET